MAAALLAIGLILSALLLAAGAWYWSTQRASFTFMADETDGNAGVQVDEEKARTRSTSQPTYPHQATSTRTPRPLSIPRGGGGETKHNDDDDKYSYAGRDDDDSEMPSVDYESFFHHDNHSLCTEVTTWSYKPTAAPGPSLVAVDAIIG